VALTRLHAVLAWIVLGETFGLRKLLGLALALTGVFVVIRYGTDRALDWPYLSSALLLALAPLSWAFYTVIGRGMPRGANTLDTTYALLFVGSLPMLLFATPSVFRTLAERPAALISASTSRSRARCWPTLAGCTRSSACPPARWPPSCS